MQQKPCAVRPASRGRRGYLFSLSFTCEEDSIGLYVIKSFRSHGLTVLWICVEDTDLNGGGFTWWLGLCCSLQQSGCELLLKDTEHELLFLTRQFWKDDLWLHYYCGFSLYIIPAPTVHLSPLLSAYQEAYSDFIWAACLFHCFPSFFCLFFN